MRPKKMYPDGKLKVIKVFMIDGHFFIARRRGGWSMPFPGRDVRFDYTPTRPSRERLLKILNRRVQERATKIILTSTGFVLDFMLD